MVIRLFIEMEVNDPMPRRAVEEQVREMFKRYLASADSRIVQSEVVYLPEMLSESHATAGTKR